MRKVILLLTLLICMAGVTSAKHRFDFLEGKYENRYYDVKIKIKSIDGGVKIKGIPGHRGWKKFFTAHNNILREAHGDHRLVIDGRYSVSIQHGRWGNRMRFLRIDNRRNNHDFYWSDWDRRYYERGGNSYGREYDRDTRRGRNYSYGYEGRNYQDISGEWYSEDLRKLVIIQNEGNGIRARLSGSDKWTRYRKGSAGNYVDERGNIYYLENDNILVWEDRNRKNRYILSRS